MRSSKVSVVIPTYNRARFVSDAVASCFYSAAPSYPSAVDLEVIVVDDGSTDDTVAVAEAWRSDVRVVKQTRIGKGNALACGFAAARGDVIVMLDADGSADSREIPRFVRALVEGADFAKGTRFAAGGGSSDITRLRRLGNRALNGLVNTLYKTQYSDLCYGYNAFWAYCLPVIGLEPEERAEEMRWGDGFEVETLINLRIAKAGLKIMEVPSFESARLHGVSNLNAVSDGLRVLKTIATERRTHHAALRTQVVDVTDPSLAPARSGWQRPASRRRSACPPNTDPDLEAVS